MNMFKPTRAKSVKEYLAAVPPERKEAMEFMHAFIQKTVPSLEPNFTTNMIGYGVFPYINSKKQTMEWPVISLASQKNYMSLYVCAVAGGTYVAESHAKDLGNVKVGKSCISFRKVEDLNLDTLKKVLMIAEKQPGLVSAAMKKK